MQARKQLPREPVGMVPHTVALTARTTVVMVAPRPRATARAMQQIRVVMARTKGYQQRKVAITVATGRTKESGCAT